jgi:hypothetical protein
MSRSYRRGPRRRLLARDCEHTLGNRTRNCHALPFLAVPGVRTLLT